MKAKLNNTMYNMNNIGSIILVKFQNINLHIQAHLISAVMVGHTFLVLNAIY